MKSHTVRPAPSLVATARKRPFVRVVDDKKQPASAGPSAGPATAGGAPSRSTSAYKKSTKNNNPSTAATGTEKPSDLKDLQALLAKHNKKFKSSHTYEPRQHTVKDVKRWEQATNKTYYKLSSNERIQANAEIAAWLQNHP